MLCKSEAPVRRRRAAAGAGSLPFVLGMCVGVAFIAFIYMATKQKQEIAAAGPVSIDIDFSKKPENPAPPPYQDPVLGQSDGSGRGVPVILETENTLLDMQDTTLGVRRPKPAQPVPASAAPAAPVTEDDAEPDATPPADGKKTDHVVSVTKYEYYWAVPYGRSFTDVGGSFYAEVVFKSFDNPKWVLGRDGWPEMKKKVRAVTSRGSIPCYQMWPEDDGNDRSTLIKMLFVCPNGTVLKEVILDKERWPTPKMTDSGK